MLQIGGDINTDASSFFAAPEILLEHRSDGSMLLRSAVPLAPFDRSVGGWLERWAVERPDRMFLAERSGTAAPWLQVSYAHALSRVRAIASWILSQRLSAEHPVVVLSDNGIEHALLALASMHVGVPIATISPAYSVASRDHAILKQMIALLEPGAIYVASLKQFAPALAAIAPLHRATVIAGTETRSHTFGGNHNFNTVLRGGGTLYIDRGKPLPQLFKISVDNLRDVAPTLYFNVPRGFDMLIPVLQGDRDLSQRFFENVKVMFYAGAALPQNLWEALEALSIESIGRPTPMVSSWGSTETAPMATDCHFQAARSGNIGVPVPGVELKLVPSGEKLEIHVRGPNVTSGVLESARSDEEVV